MSVSDFTCSCSHLILSLSLPPSGNFSPAVSPDMLMEGVRCRGVEGGLLLLEIRAEEAVAVVVE